MAIFFSNSSSVRAVLASVSRAIPKALLRVTTVKCSVNVSEASHTQTREDNNCKCPVGKHFSSITVDPSCGATPQVARRRDDTQWHAARMNVAEGDENVAEGTTAYVWRARCTVGWYGLGTGNRIPVQRWIFVLNFIFLVSRHEGGEDWTVSNLNLSGSEDAAQTAALLIKGGANAGCKADRRRRGWDEDEARRLRTGLNTFFFAFTFCRGVRSPRGSGGRAHCCLSETGCPGIARSKYSRPGDG